MTESESFTGFCRGLERLYHLSPGSLDASKPLATINGWVSLDQVEFVLFADEEYGVNVSGDQLRRCVTVGDLAMLIPDGIRAKSDHAL